MAERLAFVTPWYGPDVPGGAAAECRATARALAGRGLPVEVLTTCARDAAAWVDHHPEGVTEEDGLTVRRFKVRPRDAERYARLQARLELSGRLTRLDEAELVRESINSDALHAYLVAERDRYRYVFIPYCFGTTWEGTAVAADRSLLIPCLHEEPFASLEATRRALRDVRAVCFHVSAERALGTVVAGGDPGNFFVVGEGVDTDIRGDAARFRARHGILDPFLLYAGRKGPEKSTPLLLDYYARYRFMYPDRQLKLVLIGPGGIYVPPRIARDVFDLGFVPPQDKYDAYAAALALCQPSRLESFSLVQMEAWLCGTPVLVSARSPVTRDHCAASGGGLWFDDFFEFVEGVELVRRDPALRARLADRGRAYVLANYRWDRVVDNYLEVLARTAAKVG